MCVIIYGAATDILPWADKAWEINPDGAGIMWDNGKGISVIKPLRSLSRVKKALRGLKDETVAVHFRLRSKGAKDHSMCHPHKTGGDGYMMHNGTISDLGNETDSDSKELAAMIPADWWDDKSADPIITSIIGKSRLFFWKSGDMPKTWGEWITNGDLMFSNDKLWTQPKVTETTHLITTETKTCKCGRPLVYISEQEMKECWKCHNKEAYDYYKAYD